MNEDHRWMYSGRKSKNDITPEWVEKTSNFLEQAFARNTGPFGVMCPCNRCYNRKPQNKSKMIEHLVDFGQDILCGYTMASVVKVDQMLYARGLMMVVVTVRIGFLKWLMMCMMHLTYL
jgi:hypothetical protein